MGSLFTEKEGPMQTVLEYLKENQLFFIDSFTTSNTVGYKLARETGVKTTRRNIFLDNQQDVGKICVQLDKLVAYAMKKGGAVGIGHPYSETVKALRECLPQYDQKIEVVGVDKLVQ